MRLSMFKFMKMDLVDRESIAVLFAAQTGVLYSIESPMAYADSNLIGHLTILEGCRNNKVKRTRICVIKFYLWISRLSRYGSLHFYEKDIKWRDYQY